LFIQENSEGKLLGKSKLAYAVFFSSEGYLTLLLLVCLFWQHGNIPFEDKSASIKVVSFYLALNCKP